VAPPDWKLCILFGCYTGLRLQDIVNLCWGQVDLDEHRVTVTPKKQRRSLASKKIIAVPLHPQLVQAIMDLPGTDDPDAPLMPSLAGRRPGGRSGLSREFLEIMAGAGIPAEVKQRLTDGSGAETITLSFHSLRHTFITALTEQGVSKDVRMGLAGQTDEAVHAGYSHLSEDQLRAGINRLPSL
jgi:integrase